MLTIRPVTRKECLAFLAKHHRHNDPPSRYVLAVGVDGPDGLAGVAVAEWPKARALCDGTTLEVSRTCTDGSPNANSMLYGAIRRAAKALGYRRIVTYTLAEEPGASLRAAGFVKVSDLPERETWSCTSRHRQQSNMFGHERRPACAKARWEWAADGAVVEGMRKEAERR